MSKESIIIKLPMIYQVEGVLNGQRKSKMFNILSSVDCEIPMIPDDRIPDGLISEKGTTLEQYASDNSLGHPKDYILFNEGGKWLTTNNGQQSEYYYKRAEHKDMESLRRSVLESYNGNNQVEKLANAWESKFFREDMMGYKAFFMDSPMYTKPLDQLGDNDVIDHYKAYLKLRGDKVNDIKYMQKKLANLSLGIDIPQLEGELMFETPDFKQIASSNEEHCKQHILKQIDGWRVYKNRLYMPTTGLKVGRTSIIEQNEDNISFSLMEPVIDNNVAKFNYEDYIGMNNYDIPLSVITSQPNIILGSSYNGNASININGLQLEEYEIVDTINKFIKNMDNRYSNISLKGYNESLSDIKLFYNICAYRRAALDNADNCDAVMMYLDNMREFLTVRQDHRDINYFNRMHKDIALLSKTPVNSPVNIEYKKGCLKISDAEKADLKLGM